MEIAHCVQTLTQQEMFGVFFSWEEKLNNPFNKGLFCGKPYFIVSCRSKKFLLVEALYYIWVRYRFQLWSFAWFGLLNVFQHISSTMFGKALPSFTKVNAPNTCSNIPLWTTYQLCSSSVINLPLFFSLYPEIPFYRFSSWCWVYIPIS